MTGVLRVRIITNKNFLDIKRAASKGRLFLEPFLNLTGMGAGVLNKS